ncbi:MAG: hypothetical protein AAFO94_18175, partial [Bacteroidota bacterium]
MDIQYFLNILWRRKWLILVAMLVPAVATYFFLDRQEEAFKANSILAYSAGTVDVTGLDLDKDNPFIQQFQLEAGFETMKTLMTSRPSVNLLTYLLLIHDLSGDQPPFRQPDEEAELHYTSQEIAELVAVMRQRVEEVDVRVQNDTLDFMIEEIAKAYGYDNKTIMEDHLRIDRIGETATMKVEFNAEHPELCSYAVNNFSDKFREYRFSIITSKDEQKVDFQKGLRDQFEKDLKTKTAALDFYKKQKDVVDLDAESKNIVGQISEIELLLEDERKKIPALKESINTYNQYLKGLGTASATSLAQEDTMDPETRQKIVNLQKQVNLYQRQLIDKGGEDEELESMIALTRQALDRETEKVASNVNADVREEREENKKDTKENSLLNLRIKAETDLIMAEASVKSMEKELARLYDRKRSLVSTDAFLDNLEGERKIALEQYTDAVNQYASAEEN